MCNRDCLNCVLETCVEDLPDASTWPKKYNPRPPKARKEPDSPPVTLGVPSYRDLLVDAKTYQPIKE